MSQKVKRKSERELRESEVRDRVEPNVARNRVRKQRENRVKK